MSTTASSLKSLGWLVPSNTRGRSSMMDELLTVSQLARRAGRPPDTLHHWSNRWYLRFPEPRAVDPRRWLWDDVAAWLAETGRDQLPAREAPKRDYRKVQTCVRIWTRDLPPVEVPRETFAWELPAVEPVPVSHAVEWMGAPEGPPDPPESFLSDLERESVQEPQTAPQAPESGLERELRLSRERDGL
jgi:hypothetical protein